MSEQQTTEKKLLGRLRETSLRERIEIAQAMIGHMCRDGRPPKMSIPVQWADEDFYITNTLADAAARIEGLETLRNFIQIKREDAERDAARFRWIIEHPATFAQMARQFAGEALAGLIDNEIQEIRETESEAKPSDFQPGDAVIYIPGHAGGDPNHSDCERGVVSSTNHKNVFVRFGTSETAQSCNPGDLLHAGKGGEDESN